MPASGEPSTGLIPPRENACLETEHFSLTCSGRLTQAVVRFFHLSLCCALRLGKWWMAPQTLRRREPWMGSPTTTVRCCRNCCGVAPRIWLAGGSLCLAGSGCLRRATFLAPHLASIGGAPLNGSCLQALPAFSLLLPCSVRCGHWRRRTCAQAAVQTSEVRPRVCELYLKPV